MFVLRPTLRLILTAAAMATLIAWTTPACSGSDTPPVKDPTTSTTTEATAQDTPAKPAKNLPLLAATPYAAPTQEAISAIPGCDAHATALLFAGANATDCGEFAPRTDNNAGHACSIKAMEASTPFVAVFGLPGIDSLVKQAIIGGPDGEMRILHYDSDSSGGSKTGAKLYYSSCPSPTVSTETGSYRALAGVPHIVCGDTGVEPELICSGGGAK